jgi:hypothetical protein
MSQPCCTMWDILIPMAFDALAGPLIHGNVVSSSRAAYPWRRAKGDALHCGGAMGGDFS